MRLASMFRGAIAGLSGGIAWLLSLLLFFGPAQIILHDPTRQSAKMLAVFSEDPPAPRMYEAPWIVPIGLLLISLIWGIAYVWVSPTWPGNWRKRGLRFGLLSWILMVPWFEFYLPWNVLREPALLVVLEMICWAGVLLVVGFTIAGVEAALKRKKGLD